MNTSSKLESCLIGNTEGDNNTTIINILSFKNNLEPSNLQPDNLISTLQYHLDNTQEQSQKISITTIILMVFVISSIALPITLLLLYIFGASLKDIQLVALYMTGAFSGIIGLIGVLLGIKSKSIK